MGRHALLQGIFPTQGLTCISYVSCIGRQVHVFTFIHEEITWKGLEGDLETGKDGCPWEWNWEGGGELLLAFATFFVFLTISTCLFFFFNEKNVIKRHVCGIKEVNEWMDRRCPMEEGIATRGSRHPTEKIRRKCRVQLFIWLREEGSRGFQRLLPGEPEGGRRLGRGKGVVGEGWWAFVAGRLSIHVPTPCSSLECVFYFKPGKSQLLAWCLAYNLWQ